MAESGNLLEQRSHFGFGKNWASYARLVTEAQIEESITGLRRLSGGDLTGKRFLDIGCGSGLHALAALRLGAREVVALDLDPDSVATTRMLLQRYADGQPWSVSQASVFDLRPESIGLFDIVYSWGVLHHTGDMFRALRTAASLVAPGGQFIMALYRRTRMCWFWKIEKRWYASAGEKAQARAQALYVGLVKLAKGRSFDGYVANYRQQRGMDFYHDVHDWLGGWPYESISPEETDRFLRQLGMQRLRAFVHGVKTNGFFGSGCDEYVYSRG